MGNDHEGEFHEIEIAIFHEIEIMMSMSEFFNLGSAKHLDGSLFSERTILKLSIRAIKSAGNFKTTEVKKKLVRKILKFMRMAELAEQAE
jgi:hypothetical protein